MFFIRLTVLSISTLLLLLTGRAEGQLIRTSEPVPSEVQIMMHLEAMMGTWEVSKAMKEQGKENPEGIIPVPPFDEERLALQLRMVEGDMKFQPGPRVKAFIHRYTREKRSETEAILGLTKAYAPLIDHEISQRKLPSQLKYLPAALSAYNTLAVNDQGHAGLWQLPFHAGLRYGLDCGAEIDQRRDPIQATRAALDYLADLYGQFGTWDLTILAYTCGPANLTKARNRTEGAPTFETLYDHLPAYGRDYWPAFVAMNYLGQYYRLHNLKALPIRLPIQKETIPIDRELDLELVSETIGMPMNYLQAMNPVYRGDAICFDGEEGSICLPKEYAQKFMAKESAIYAKAKEESSAASEPEVEEKTPPTKVNTPPKPVVKKPSVPANSKKVIYTIRQGDNLGRIAQAYGVRVSQIQSWNGLSNSNIRAGDKLTLHVPKAKAGAVNVQQAPKPTGQKSKASTYTVKSGDSLWGISQKFEGVTAEDIMEANGISADIKPGQVLKIPAGK